MTTEPVPERAPLFAGETTDRVVIQVLQTMIIGFASGTLGILVTYLLCVPIDLVLHHLTGCRIRMGQKPLPLWGLPAR